MRQAKSYWHYGILLALGVAPFFKGLFEPLPQLIAAAGMVAGCAWLWLSRPKKVMERLHPLDYVVLALAGLYLLSSLWGVNQRMALGEAVKQLLYVGAYWFVSRSIADSHDRERFIKGIATVVVAVAVGAIVIGAGWVPYTDAIFANRLGGPFEYPNAFAAYLMLGLGIVMALRASADTLKEKLQWGLSFSALAIVFVFTYSRIAFVAVLFTVVAVLVLLPKANRVRMVEGGLAAAAAVAAVLVPFDRVLRTEQYGMIPLWFGVGLMVSLGVELLLHHSQGRTWLRRSLIALGAVALVLGLIIVAPRATSLVGRLTAMSVQDQSLSLRLWTYRDALRAWWTESPVLGMGGGAWRVVYSNYRSFDFVSRLVHSSVVETVTELGVQGALLLLGTWGLSLYLAWKGWRKSATPASAALFAGVIGGVLGLVLHSMMDFDLWYPALTVTLYAVFGALRSVESTATPLPKGRSASPAVRLGVATGLVAILGGLLPLLVATFNSNTGVRQFSQGKPVAEVRKLFAAATRYDPLNPAFAAQYGDLLVQLGVQLGSAKDVREGGQYLERAVRQDPYSPQNRALLGHYYAAIGDDARAFESMDQSSKLDPAAMEPYRRALRQGFAALSADVANNRADRVKVDLTMIGAVIQRYERFRDTQSSGVPIGRLPAQDAETWLYEAELAIYSKRLDEARPLLTVVTQAADPELQKQGWLWKTVLERQANQATAASEALTRLNALDSSLVAQVLETQQRVAKVWGIVQ